MSQSEPPVVFGYRQPAFPWLGALLLVVGGALLVHALVPQLDGTGLASTAVGAGLVVAWLRGRTILAMWAAVVLLGYGVAQLAVGLDVVDGRGWTTLGVGAGLAVGWLVAQARSRGWDFVLLLAALFVLVGLAQVAEHVQPLAGLDRVAAPVVILAIGLLVVIASFRGRSRGPRW